MRTVHLIALSLSLVLPSIGAAQLACCSRITAIDQRTGLVSATATPSGTTFQFQVRDRILLARLRINQQVYADFPARTVGLDARQACCTIVGTPVTPRAGTAPGTSATPPTSVPAGRVAPPPNAAPAAPRTGAQPSAGSPATVGSMAPVAAISMSMPSATFGAPYTRSTPRAGGKGQRIERRTATMNLGGRSTQTTILHLRGVKAIEQATELPDGARRLLLMHAGTVPREQSDQYIVNTELAREWIASHPVPAYVKVAKPPQENCDNWYDSFDCAGQAVSDEWERAWERAVNAWKDATGKLADEWKTTSQCFVDHTLPVPGIPVRFQVAPSMTVSLEQSVSRGSVSGSVTGSATLGVPLDADFKAQLDLYYIPCLPFAVRPRSLAADGVLSVGEELKASVSATGTFSRTFTIPPTGGPVIPIQVFPIVIGGVPVAELDVSAYVEGNIQVSATGRAEGHFQVRNTHPTRFSFSCSGKGCTARSQGMTAPVTASEGAQLDGRVSVKPAIYTALQLDFNYEALSARAGPQPYLLGMASGCTAVAGSQTSGGPSTASENHVLTADLDWGAELRAEALVFRTIVGSPYVTRLMQDRHLWFRDLAPGGSSALAATLESASAAQATRPASYRMRMPSCYPYADNVRVRVAWTGNAAPAPHPQCQWQAGQGSCTLDPKKELTIGFTWPSAGTWALTATTVGDVHNRTFSPAPATQTSVTVAPPP